jgi:hypothetical protein
VKALSRVSGCYAILNYDRKLMDQTGEGHYSPVTGYHRGEDRSLILDVARYKYPSHWAQIPFIYNSLAKKDPQSCLPRGMVLVSRNIDKFANICRITPDYSLAQELTDYFKRPEQQEKFSKLITLQGLELAQGFMEFLSSLPEHFWDSIVLHALQICPLLDDVTKREKTLASMAHLSTPAPKFARWQELPHSALREVFEDLFPQEGREVLDFFWFHFRQQYASTKKSCPLLLPPLFLLANS